MPVLKLLRIKHWIKNLFVFVPLLFAKEFSNLTALENSIFVFILFSFTASLVYVINDLHDLPKDKNHPVKKYRPLASGEISVNQAFVIIAVLALLVLIVALLSGISRDALIVILLYLIINLFYTFKLKQIAIIDILTISSGYVLRIYAGAFAIAVPVSHWLIITIIFLSLFLASLKRGAELRKQKDGNETRKVLDFYSEKLIDILITVATTGVILSYILYSVSDKIYTQFNSYNFVFTAVFPMYGLFRTLQLYYLNEKGEDTIEMLLKDFPSVLNLILYGVSLFYFFAS